MESLQEETSYGGRSGDRTNLLPKKKSSGKWKKTTLKVMGLFIIVGLAAVLGVIAGTHLSTATNTVTSAETFGSAVWDGLTGKKPKLFKDDSFQVNLGMRNDYLLQDCLHNGLKKAFPDLDYVFLGYHILKGYPMAHGQDPGFTSPIFKADYSRQKQTADCAFSVPDGYTIIPDISCETSFTSKVVKSTEDLRSAMEASAKVSGGGWGVSFGASSDYKQASESVQSSEKVYVFSKATCHYYSAKLDRINPPPLSDSFVHQLKKLNNSKSIDDYIDFIDYFGTHFVTGMTLGARYMKQHSMSTSTYKSLSSKSISVEVQASYSGLFFHAGASAGFSDSQQKAISEFSQSVETRTTTVGSAPPQDGDAMTWASTVKEHPVPFRYEMASIEDLFKPAYMKRYPEIDMVKLRKNIKFVKTRKADAIYEKAIDGDSGCRVFNAPFVFPSGIMLIGNSNNSFTRNLFDLQWFLDTCSKSCLHDKDCLGYSHNIVDFLFTCTAFNISENRIVHLTAVKSNLKDDKYDTRVYPFKLKIKTSSYLMKQEPGILYVRNIRVDGLDNKLDCSTDDKHTCEERCVTKNSCILAFQKQNPNNEKSYCCGLVDSYNMPQSLEVNDDPNEYLAFVKTKC